MDRGKIGRADARKSLLSSIFSRENSFIDNMCDIPHNKGR